MNEYDSIQRLMHNDDKSEKEHQKVIWVPSSYRKERKESILSFFFPIFELSFHFLPPLILSKQLILLLNFLCTSTLTIPFHFTLDTLICKLYIIPINEDKNLELYLEEIGVFFLVKRHQDYTEKKSKSYNKPKLIQSSLKL